MSRIELSAVGLLTVISLVLVSAISLNAANNGERRIAIFNIHTDETLDIVYMRDGKRIDSAMKRINWIMRDYRENKPTKMDPKLIDLLWEIHTELGSREPIHLISGYRSPKTNAMLRRTRGGQAKKSRHMLGSASDVHFPDIPVKRLRYSALIRERGGVGYYPTSALPFVHVDTGRVRHWPRMPRYELALLFPNGRSLHRPKGGGRISKRDVRKARSKHKKLSRQVTAFFDARGQPAPPRPVQVASAVRSKFRTQVTFANAAGTGFPTQPKKPSSQNIKVAALGPMTLPAPKLVANPARAKHSAPVLRGQPRLADRPSTLKPQTPSTDDKRKLTELFTLASLVPAAKTILSYITGTKGDSADPQKDTTQTAENSSVGASKLTIAMLLARDVPPPPPANENPTPIAAPITEDWFNWATGWVAAPAYDDEHPEELYYRPFPIAALMTQTSSPHDPALATMTHPDVAGTLTFIDDSLSALPMKLRPGKRIAASMWSNRFTITADNADEPTPAIQAPPRIANRSVRTSVQ